MENVVTNLTLDLDCPGAIRKIRARKGDTARVLRVVLFDDGNRYPLTPECTAAMAAKKPDGKVIFNNCTVADGVIEYHFTSQTTSCQGPVALQLRVYGADGAMIVAAPIALEVLPSVAEPEEAGPVRDEMTALDALMSRTNTALQQMEHRLETDDFRGESAYQAAVKNGFQGTEQQWIDSLRYDHSREFAELAEQVRADMTAAESAAGTAAHSSTAAGTAADTAARDSKASTDSAGKASASAGEALQARNTAQAHEEAAAASADSAAASAAQAAKAGTAVAASAQEARTAAAQALKSWQGASHEAGLAIDYASRADTAARNSENSAAAARTQAESAAGHAAAAAASAETAQTQAQMAQASADTASAQGNRAVNHAKQAAASADTAQREAERSSAAADRSVSHGITGAQVGDKILVSAVDSSGVPTAWKTEGKMEHIITVTAKDASPVLIDRDKNGQPLRLRAALIRIQAPSGFKTFIVSVDLNRRGQLGSYHCISKQVNTSLYLIRVGEAHGYYTFEASSMYYINETGPLEGDTYRGSLYKVEGDPINYITLTSFTADGQIEVYGVRA